MTYPLTAHLAALDARNQSIPKTQTTQKTTQKAATITADVAPTATCPQSTNRPTNLQSTNLQNPDHTESRHHDQH